ncbi:MAG: alginate lyase family protein, partial [Acidobacteriota bacterium]
MQIGILGSGNVGGALGRRWAAAGHPVLFASRDRDSPRLAGLANAARDLALAYRLTGNITYAEKAAWILNAYAERYPALPLHDRDNRNTRSGARVHAQTLDEAIWLLPLAWAFDLLQGADILSPDQSARIERHLLREAAATILRHDAGISNWQSWHNAALAAVAVTLNDSPLLSQAL